MVRKPHPARPFVECSKPGTVVCNPCGARFRTFDESAAHLLYTCEKVSAADRDALRESYNGRTLLLPPPPQPSPGEAPVWLRHLACGFMRVNPPSFCGATSKAQHSACGGLPTSTACLRASCSRRCFTRLIAGGAGAGLPEDGGSPTKKQRTDADAAANVDFAERGGFSDAVLASAAAHSKKFDATTEALVAGAVACAHCNRVAFGGKHSLLRHKFKPQPCHDGAPPGLLSNPLTARLKFAPTEEGQEQMWWCCQACHTGATGAKRRQKQADDLQPAVVPDDIPEEELQAALQEWRDMLGIMLSLPTGASLQMAVLRCGVRFAQRIKGYLHSLQAGEMPHILGGPLVNWNPAAVSPNRQLARLQRYEHALHCTLPIINAPLPCCSNHCRTTTARSWLNS